MKRALDSAWPPSDGSIAQAKAAGVSTWAGYFWGPNILNGWTQPDFHRVQNGGLATLAYCSGLADPLAMRSQSLAWDVPIALDVEGGIRGDGPWVQDWVNKARSGLYGNPGVFTGRTAQFFVCAAYPGYNPNADWPPYLARPSVPCGWQYQGTSKYFGMTVDLSWFDDELVALLAGGYAMGTVGALDETWLTQAKAVLDHVYGTAGTNTTPTVTAAALLAAIKAVPAGSPANIQPALDAIANLQRDVTSLANQVTKIENALKGA